MWIFLSVLGAILLILIIALLLPVSLFLGGGKDKDLTLLLKVPFKTIDLTKQDKTNENSDKIKELFGVQRLENKDNQTSKTSEFIDLLKDKISLILGLLKRLLELLGKSTVKTLKLNIVCAESDAAKTAINYGICYAVISPLINFLHSTMKVNRKGEKINIYSDFDGNDSSFDFEIIISVAIFRVAAAALRLIFDEAKRTAKETIKKEKA